MTSVGTLPDKAAARWFSWWELLLFLCCSLGGMVIVFGASLWSDTVLSPLDIPPALYSKYQWLDESQGNVPRNHYLVDFFDHELPRQYTTHRAVQSGEFPWWDPYTDAGRPLAAEAHNSVTDPLRLVLYRYLPFVPAYNWTRLLHSLLLGTGAFLLLRHWGHRLGICLAMALAFQFSGTFALFQNPICLPASAAWYAWIWLAWSNYLNSQEKKWIGAAGLFFALSVMAGNQQTHAFLAVFVACFALGNLWYDRQSWKPALTVSFFSSLFGCLIALPVLLPQIELYLLCERSPALAAFPKMKLLTGAASLTGLFPWALGTFRTLDASKLFGETGLGFCLFIGSTAFVLALIGGVRIFRRSGRTSQGCVALLLVLAYLTVCSTPLIAVFYTRLAGLCVLGLVVLAAEGTRDILKGNISSDLKRTSWLSAFGILCALICCNVFAFLIYPRIQCRLESALLAREKDNVSFDIAPELRRFQVKNLAREISIFNFETIISGLGVAALLAGLYAGNGSSRRRWLSLALLLNLVPELSFAKRFTSHSPVDRLTALLVGGPEQRRVAATVTENLRLADIAPGRFDRLFPGATSHYYGVHSSGGYSSFPLPDLKTLWNQEGHAELGVWVDATYKSDQRGLEAGELEVAPLRATSSRFQWPNQQDRPVRIVSETLNTITVEVEKGPPGILWRTDRYYPGWRLLSPNLETHVKQEAFLTVEVPSDKQVLVFHYRPRWHTLSIFMASAALLLCLGCLVIRTPAIASSSKEI